jgi:hypothetical protein
MEQQETSMEKSNFMVVKLCSLNYSCMGRKTLKINVLTKKLKAGRVLHTADHEQLGKERKTEMNETFYAKDEAQKKMNY